MIYRYEDPTGGGDDVFLDVPADTPWKPIDNITLEDGEGEEYDFALVGEEKEETD